MWGLQPGYDFHRTKENKIDKTYTQDRIKQSQIHYQANELTCTFTNKEKKNINIIFRVSNNDIAFRYEMPKYGDTGSIVIEKETTGFDFPPSPLLSCARKVTP